MKTQITVIRPVEIDICRGCQFAVHTVDSDDPSATIVWCMRRDCDNAGAERLEPLRPAQQDVVIPLNGILPLASVGWPIIVVPHREPSVRRTFCAQILKRLEKWLLR